MSFPQIGLFEGSVIIICLIIVWSIYRAHKSTEYANFNFFDLLVDNGRISRIACVFMGTWAITSAVVWKLVIDGKMNEGYFTAYCAAWVAPIIAKLYTQPSAPPVDKPKEDAKQI